MAQLIKVVLLLIFCTSTYLVFDFGSGLVRTDSGFNRPGYIGGAIGFALIASSALLAFVYFICNYSKQRQNNNF